MYAVIVTGGKQYRVQEGQRLKIEKLEAEAGAAVTFDKILLIQDGSQVQLGAPYLKAKVVADVIQHGRHDKIKVIKIRRRKHHRKQMGHRQWFTEVKITQIQAA